MKRLPLCLSLVLIFSACDRAPTDPSLPFESGSTLLTGASEVSLFSVSATSLPHLLRTSVLRAEAERGPAASRILLGTWQRLNQQAQAALKAGDRPTAQTLIAAVRAEEIRIVLSALGNSAASRVVEEVGVGLAYARIRLNSAQALGRDVTRASALSNQVAALILDANRGLQARDYPRALDAGVQASDLLDGVHRSLVSMSAIRSLETMFPESLRKVTREWGSARAAALVQQLDRLNDQARATLRAGDRDDAQRSLEAVRQEQIRLVLLVQGPDIVGVVTAGVDRGVVSTRARLGSLREPRLAQRAERMITEAASLNARAKMARKEGDPARALDLASHAAGLINALQLLLR